jgi:hypothetical protein
MPSTTRAAAKKSPTRPAAKSAAPSRAATPKPTKALQPAKTSRPSTKPAAPSRVVPPAKAKFETPAKAKFESPAPVTAPTKEKPAKAKVRVALVRDGFTMPAADFALIAALKARALAGQREAKKSELLRAGLHALAALDGSALVQALNRLEPIKTGRPKKNH